MNVIDSGVSPTLERPAPAVQVVNVLQIEAMKTPHRQTVLRTAEFEDPRDGRRFRVGYSRQQQAQNISPPHRHTFDQVRFVVSGKTRYGPMRLNSGDCAYFPEGVFYGPTEPLSEEIVSCTIQTQGPSWGPFPTDRECAVAGERLKGEGQMDRASGQFLWNDGRRQDSFEAMLEHLLGQSVEYPPARYRTPVQLRTDNFSWLASTRDNNVFTKPLARFNAGGPDLELLRIMRQATLSASREAQHRMFLVFSGTGFLGEQPLSEGSYIYSPPGAELGAIRAEQDMVLFATRFESRSGLPG